MNSVIVEKGTKKARYLELFDSFRQKIEDGQLPPGSQMPTFVELRAREGVSRSTVEQAYSRLEQQGLIRREQGRGTFVASRDSQLTRQIGFIGTSFRYRHNFAHAANLVDGIESVLQREQLSLLLLRDDDTSGLERVDGILLCSGRPLSVTEEIAARLPAHVPCVSMLMPIPGMPCVRADDYGGGQLCARELIARGHRRISALLQYSEIHGRMRLRGLSDEMTEAGIVSEANWFRDPHIRNGTEGYRHWGRTAMNLWLADGWRKMGCTAIFVQNDIAAIGVIDALREAGLRVPEDVSVVGFDGTDICDLCSPSLASVQVPHQQIGSAGMELLWQQIRTGISQESHTVFPCTFRPGGSLGPAPAV